MSDVKRTYLRLKREGQTCLRLDVFNRDGTQGETIAVSVYSLEKAAEYLLSTKPEQHAFLTLPGASEES